MRLDPGRAGCPFGERRLLGQHGADRADFAALEGIGEALHDRSQAPVAERPQARLLAWVRQPSLDRLAGAKERPVDPCDRGLKRLRSLLGGETEDVAEDQHGSLAGGQIVQGGDAGQLELLAPLIPSLGLRVAIGVAKRLVRIPLERIARRGLSGASRGPVAGPKSIGSTRLGRQAIASRQALVAIRYSQVRSELSPRKFGSARQARRRVFWSASSASCSEPSIR